MDEKYGRNSPTTTNNNGKLNVLMIALALVASIGAMMLVLQWFNNEVGTYNKAVAATIQATIGACGMGNIEFHMPDEAQSQVRAGCIKLVPTPEESEMQ